MKRSMLLVCAALLAFAVGCGKKKDEKKADDKGGEMKPTDPATAGGDAPADMVAICKKIEVYNARLKDCVKDMGAEAAKKDPKVAKEFGDCINAAPSFTAALENCKQF